MVGHVDRRASSIVNLNERNTWGEECRGSQENPALTRPGVPEETSKTAELLGSTPDPYGRTT